MTLDNSTVCSSNGQWVSKSFIKCLKEPFFKESNVVKITLKNYVSLKYDYLELKNHQQKIRDNY